MWYGSLDYYFIQAWAPDPFDTRFLLLDWGNVAISVTFIACIIPPGLQTGSYVTRVLYKGWASTKRLYWLVIACLSIGLRCWLHPWVSCGVMHTLTPRICSWLCRKARAPISRLYCSTEILFFDFFCFSDPIIAWLCYDISLEGLDRLLCSVYLFFEFLYWFLQIYSDKLCKVGVFCLVLWLVSFAYLIESRGFF